MPRPVQPWPGARGASNHPSPAHSPVALHHLPGSGGNHGNDPDNSGSPPTPLSSPPTAPPPPPDAAFSQLPPPPSIQPDSPQLPDAADATEAICAGGCNPHASVTGFSPVVLLLRPRLSSPPIRISPAPSAPMDAPIWPASVVKDLQLAREWLVVRTSQWIVHALKNDRLR